MPEVGVGVGVGVGRACCSERVESEKLTCEERPEGCLQLREANNTSLSS